MEPPEVAEATLILNQGDTDDMIQDGKNSERVMKPLDPELQHHGNKS